MTHYLLGRRPLQLPPLPDLALCCPSTEMRDAARVYLDATAGPSLVDLDCETNAIARPGADPEVMLTDREFAEAVLVSDVHAERQPNVLAAPTASASSRRSQALRPAFVVGKLLVGRGRAVMNTQVLRSPVFNRPALGEVYAPLADRRSFEISVTGFSLTQDHADLLLYGVSQLRHEPIGTQGALVSFTRRGFFNSLGWTSNKDSYAKFGRTLGELAAARLTFRDRGRPSSPPIAANTPLIVLQTDVRHGDASSCSFALPAGLIGLLRFGRNTCVDLDARAAVRGHFGRWMHAFIASQTPGLERTYDAQAVCAAGGLVATRLADQLKTLRSTLEQLERGTGARVRGGALPTFSPVVASGWRVVQDCSGWTLSIARALPAQLATGHLKPCELFDAQPSRNCSSDVNGMQFPAPPCAVA